MAVTQSGRKYIKFGAASDTLNKTLCIKFIRWVGANTGDNLVIKNTAGEIIAESAANTDNFVDIIPIMDQIVGIDIDTMGSGTVIVYIK